MQSAGTQIDSEIGQSRNNSRNNQLTVRAVQHVSDQAQIDETENIGTDNDTQETQRLSAYKNILAPD